MSQSQPMEIDEQISSHRGILSGYMLSKRQASAYMIDIDMR